VRLELFRVGGRVGRVGLLLGDLGLILLIFDESRGSRGPLLTGEKLDSDRIPLGGAVKVLAAKDEDGGLDSVNGGENRALEVVVGADVKLALEEGAGFEAGGDSKSGDVLGVGEGGGVSAEVSAFATTSRSSGWSG
jgi:hypothetical protein